MIYKGFISCQCCLIFKVRSQVYHLSVTFILAELVLFVKSFFWIIFKSFYLASSLLMSCYLFDSLIIISHSVGLCQEVFKILFYARRGLPYLCLSLETALLLYRRMGLMSTLFDNFFSLIFLLITFNLIFTSF